MTVNSSDWIADAAAAGALSAGGASGAAVPDWIAAFGVPSEFSAASPFAQVQPAEETPETSRPSEPAQPQTEWDRGYAQGKAAAHEALEAKLAQMDDERMALRLAFRQLDQAAMDALAAELAETVLSLCDAALADHAADPDALQKRARAAATRLGSAAQSCTLHLNPDDLALLEEGALAEWETVPDPALERGSIELSGPEGGVRDGPAEWRRAIAAALRG